MSNLLMSGYTFAAELKGLGVHIPEHTTEIQITLETDKPATIMFKTVSLTCGFMLKSKGSLPKEMTSEKFHNELAKVITLPQHISKLTITANLDDVVEMEIHAALPQRSLEFIKV